MHPAVALSLSLLQAPAPVSVSAIPRPSTPVVASPEPGRRLVFANLYGLAWSIRSGIPSGELSVFLGSSLRPRLSVFGHRWNTALGYELALSLGGADYATLFYSWGGGYGLFEHRHHFAALGFGGPGDRLYYHVGGGLLMWRTTPVALEADVRLGVVLGIRRGTRIKGVVGGQARIVGVLGGVPIPHIGLFVGLFVF